MERLKEKLATQIRITPNALPPLQPPFTPFLWSAIFRTVSQLTKRLEEAKMCTQNALFLRIKGIENKSSEHLSPQQVLLQEWWFLVLWGAWCVLVSPVLLSVLSKTKSAGHLPQSRKLKLSPYWTNCKHKNNKDKRRSRSTGNTSLGNLQARLAVSGIRY